MDDLQASDEYTFVPEDVTVVIKEVRGTRAPERCSVTARHLLTAACAGGPSACAGCGSGAWPCDVLAHEGESVDLDGTLARPTRPESLARGRANRAKAHLLRRVPGWPFSPW